MRIAGMETHAAADLLPLIDGEAFEAFVSSIRDRGLVEPITIHEGKILDGRNRARGCEAAGVKPRFVKWNGEGGSPVGYVVSKNLDRRNLNESQRALVGAEALVMLAVEAKERQRASGGDRKSVTANLREPIAETGTASEKASLLVNVSPRSIESAARVLKGCVPEMINEVRSGRVKVSSAGVLADLPVSEQRVIVAGGLDAIRAAVREQRGGTSGSPSRVPPDPDLRPPLSSSAAMHAALGCLVVGLTIAAWMVIQ